jgi:hypothetical protein
MPLTQRARFLGLLCCVALPALGAGLAHAAPGAAPECRSRSLSPADELAVTAAAGAVVPRTITFQIVERCVTAEDSYAWIATARTRSRDAEQWWEYTCRKGLMKWSCGEGEFRQLFAVHLQAPERTQGLQAITHGEVGADNARALAAAALQIYANPAAHLAECNRHAADARDWSTLPPAERALPTDGPVDADVWHKGDADVVDFNLQTRFVFAARQPDARNPVPRCWSFLALGQ